VRSVLLICSRRVVQAAFVLLLSLSLAYCERHSETPLEELPAEIAANLQSVPGTELLVGFPPRSPERGEPAPGALPLKKACQSTQEIFSYVLFPMTICLPNPNFGDVLSDYQTAITPPTAAPGGAQVKSYKLSSFEGRTFVTPQFCFQTSGPFGATIVKKVDCEDVTTCEMALPCPACPVLMWSGQQCESEGRPSEVQFIGELTERAIQFSKCPGSLSQCDTGEPEPPPVPQ
jgi:hypothetical protein